VALIRRRSLPKIESVHPAVRAGPADRVARGRPDGDSARVAQSHHVTLARFIERFDAPIVHPCQRVQIGFVGSLERRADEPGPGAFADDHSGRARQRSTQIQGVGSRAATAKPKALANVSARSRSGFSNSSQARSVTLIVGLTERPLCSHPVGSVTRCGGPRVRRLRWGADSSWVSPVE